MLFEFDADQRQWQRTVREVLAERCPATFVRDVVDRGADPRQLWDLFVELGWTEMTDPKVMVELAVVLEELGRATDPTPFLATVTQFAPLAPGVAAPDQTGAAVFDGVTALRVEGGWALNGTAKLVLDADRAQWLAVVTDTGVFTVPVGQVTIRRVSALDPALHLADVTFEDVQVTVDQRTGADVAAARELALTGMALTMVGACRRILDLTLEHVTNRRQFDAPIGSFQAVQHKAADMHIAVERARALAYYAALTIAEEHPDRRRAASMAKAAAGQCQSLVFRNGFQLFGGMGFTWENDLQFALKRAKAGELMLGGSAQHRAFIAEESHAADL